MTQLIFGVWFALFLLLRIGLLLQAGTDDVPLGLWPAVLIKGLWFDVVVLSAALAPIGILDGLFSPQSQPGGRIRRSMRIAFLGLSFFLMLFGITAEVVFWQEFSSRFNFIAVDYLLYTHEVIGNILESYPVGLIVGLLLLLATAMAIAADRWQRQQTPAYSQFGRFARALGWIILPVLLINTANLEQMEGTGNTFADELSGNGLFTFAAALRRNELSYDRFYPTMSDTDASALLQSLSVERAGPEGEDPESDVSDDPIPLRRRPRNIILISVESLSASYVGAFGGTAGLTPNLDRMAKDGYRFTRFFATGTRTVRGLEALSLGTPPIPGQSIVRRPANEHLSTLGGILGEQGFDPWFFYGGYGYFDNMNAYFAANGYTVIDRTDITANDIVFENIWGVADESLYHKVINTLSAAQASDRPFFAHVMTTSNHRPYTYPSGRIDIPSPGGRYGAVKYTDHAIGQFIAEAKTRPWFKDTLFIFTADHCASVAGKSRLPVDRYHIPLIFYGPDLIDPGMYAGRLSQIDLAPTIVELLGAKGDSQFFGRSFFEPGPRPDIAFISNYQSLGYWRHDLLTVLLPGGRTEAWKVDPQTFASTPAPVDERLRQEAIAFYQTAAHDFSEGRLKLDHGYGLAGRSSTTTLPRLPSPHLSHAVREVFPGQPG